MKSCAGYNQTCLFTFDVVVRRVWETGIQLPQYYCLGKMQRIFPETCKLITAECGATLLLCLQQVRSVNPTCE